MKIKNVIVGPLETNCYLLINSGKCFIIDPGEEAALIEKAIGDYKVVGIIITHYHFDHIGALEALKNKYQVEVYDFHNLKEGMNQIENFKFEVLFTPGHKEDSISLLFEKNMFVGDFIFKNSIGRTDLEGGNFEQMKESIQKLKSYPNDIILYPGHGELTTLEEEKKYNMFF
jgi:hydroxyacylglutathione hydrolase